MWNSIIGHKKQIDQLVKTANAKRLPSSYLFTGPRGVGKYKVAKTLASHILCVGKDKPCDKCATCRKIDHEQHPDVHMVKAEASQIKINQMREIINKIQLHALEGAYKIVIIDDAEKMNQAAANSVLKTLEEPPADTLFILITSNANSLLPTILSRCQRIFFSPLPHEYIKKHWADKAELNDSYANILAHLSEGTFLDLSLDNETIECTYNDLHLLSKKSNAEDLLRVAELWAQEKEKIEGKLILLKSCFMDTLFFKRNIKNKIINEPIKPLIETLSSSRSEESILSSISSIDEVQNHLDDTTNKQLMFEQLLFRLSA